MERLIEIFTQILFLGWPALVILAALVALGLWLVRRRRG